LGALGEDQRKALQRGSVFGRRFWNGGLEYLGLSTEDTLLEGLQQRGYIEALPTSTFEGQPEWRFHHNLMRDVAYESILKRERIGLHKRAGGWIQIQARGVDRLDEFAGVVGYQSERAHEPDQAADWFVRAGDRAWTQSAIVEARQFFDRALELISSEDKERRWKALLGRDQVLSLQADTEQREADTATLLELATEFDDPNRLAEAYYRRGGYFESLGDNPSAVEAFSNSIEAAQLAGDQNLLALAMGMSISCNTRLGNFPEAASLTEGALTFLGTIGNESTRARILANAAIYYAGTGDLSKAATLYENQVEITRQIGNKAGEAIGLMSLGFLYMQMGMFEKACDELEKSLLLNEAIRARRQRAFTMLNLALAHWRRENYPRCQTLLQEVEMEFEAWGDVFGKGARLSYSGLCMESMGNISGAIGAYSKAREIFKDSGLLSFAQDALAGLARCYLAQGNEQEAFKASDELWDYLQKGGGKGLEFPINAYLTCATTFKELCEAEKSLAAVEAGYRELIDQATMISDEDWCTSYMDQVPEHRAIQELWARRIG